MKKLLATTLAASMVLSMGSVAFAATTLGVAVDPEFGKTIKVKPVEWHSEDGEVRADGATWVDCEIGFGDTAYYPIFGRVTTGNTAQGPISLVYQADAVKGLKLKANYDLGASLVSKTSVVKKKLGAGFKDNYNNNAGVTEQIGDTVMTGGQNYAYFIAVETKDSNSTTAQYISGKVEMDKSRTGGQDYKDELDYDVNRLQVDLTVRSLDSTADLTTVKAHTTVPNPDGLPDINYVNEDKHVYKFNDNTSDGLNESEDMELVLIDDDTATFTFNSFGQGKLVLSADNRFISDAAAKFPSANLDFITVTASSSFNKIGELRIFAPEGRFLYSVGSDGTLTKAKAAYDSTDEAYVIKTRTIGSYVIADQELDLGDEIIDDTVVPEEPTVEVPKIEAPINPGTGAAC